MTTPEPEGYPATVTAVAEWLGVPEGTGGGERAHIAVVVPAVNAWVEDLYPAEVAAQTLRTKYVQGAVMLAARIVRRRNSPAGVESFGELGATYVSRYDPDVERLLELGPHRRPVIG